MPFEFGINVWLVCCDLCVLGTPAVSHRGTPSGTPSHRATPLGSKTSTPKGTSSAAGTPASTKSTGSRWKKFRSASTFTRSQAPSARSIATMSVRNGYVTPRSRPGSIANGHVTGHITPVANRSPALSVKSGHVTQNSAQSKTVSDVNSHVMPASNEKPVLSGRGGHETSNSHQSQASNRATPAANETVLLSPGSNHMTLNNNQSETASVIPAVMITNPSRNESRIQVSPNQTPADSGIQSRALSDVKEHVDQEKSPVDESPVPSTKDGHVTADSDQLKPPSQEEESRAPSRAFSDIKRLFGFLTPSIFETPEPPAKSEESEKSGHTNLAFEDEDVKTSPTNQTPASNNHVTSTANDNHGVSSISERVTPDLMMYNGPRSVSQLSGLMPLESIPGSPDLSLRSGATTPWSIGTSSMAISCAYLTPSEIGTLPGL